MELGKLRHNGCRTVGRPVVDNQNLGMPRALTNDAQNLTESCADAGAFVVGGYDDTDRRTLQRGVPKPISEVDSLIPGKFYATLLLCGASVAHVRVASPSTESTQS